MTNTSEAMRLLSGAKEAGINYSDVARQVGVSPSTVTRWMKGVSTPSPAQMRKLHRLKKAQWSVVKLWSPNTPQVFFVATVDPARLIPALVRGRDQSPEAIYCRKLRHSVSYEVVMNSGSKLEAKAVKRALDKEARKPKLALYRGGLSHPRSASKEAALSPLPSPDSAASNSQ